MSSRRLAALLLVVAISVVLASVMGLDFDAFDGLGFSDGPL
jgi:hypothetical protein